MNDAEALYYFLGLISGVVGTMLVKIYARRKTNA